MDIFSNLDDSTDAKEMAIVDLLSSAGYHSVQLREGSSPSEIINLGIVWCLEKCGLALDLGDNSSKRVVTSLESLGCLYRIKPMQIQSSDLRYLEPVVRWLVSETEIRTRENATTLRSYKSTPVEYELQIENLAFSTTTLGTVVTNLLIDKEKVREDFDCLKHELGKKSLQLLKLSDEHLGTVRNLMDIDFQIIETLEKLLEKSEDIKGKEIAFKADCKNKVKELQARNEFLKKRRHFSSNCAKSDIVNAKSMLALKRERLSEKSRVVEALERKVDNLPNSYELFQYQRRFIELDNQMACEYSETQQFYNLFNTLEAQKVFMSREVSMFNSILESLPKNDSPLTQKEHFLKQLEALVREVGESLTKAISSFQADEERKTNSARGLNGILEYNRQFMLLAQDMRKELKKNAILSEKVDAAAFK